ncbi:hypothetical protein BaRGS_00001502, partial [Batillaria attramentaria]
LGSGRWENCNDKDLSFNLRVGLLEEYCSLPHKVSFVAADIYHKSGDEWIYNRSSFPYSPRITAFGGYSTSPDTVASPGYPWGRDRGRVSSSHPAIVPVPPVHLAQPITDARFMTLAVCLLH